MDLPALGQPHSKPAKITHYLLKRIQNSSLLHKVHHNLQWCANCAVLGAVHICGHGWESATAGILLFLIVAGLVVFKETNL
jgi:hypothetical protein